MKAQFLSGGPKSRRQLDPVSPPLGRMGQLETRLARNKSEIQAAQALRYCVFYEELGAVASTAKRITRRDKDGFDRHCDHLLVIDNAGGGKKIVGTYRMLPDRHAQRAGGFYSQTEFDLTPVLDADPDKCFLELGRSCILPDYRSKRVMELLWQGTWAYAVNNKIDILFGCASFPGTNPRQHSAALSWLVQNAKLEIGDCKARTADGVDLMEMPDTGADDRRALASMPPLLKGYLRLGAKVASQAVIDHRFGTTDVLVVLKVADINPRYLAHYGANASRYAA